MREAESIMKDPLSPCHSRKPGITIGAAFANKTAGVTNRRGKRTEKMNPIPSNIIILKMIVLFFKRCTPHISASETQTPALETSALDNVLRNAFSHKDYQ